MINSERQYGNLSSALRLFSTTIAANADPRHHEPILSRGLNPEGLPVRKKAPGVRPRKSYGPVLERAAIRNAEGTFNLGEGVARHKEVRTTELRGTRSVQGLLNHGQTW
jgi:hypothetical protein